jgi:hypothetical protein
MMQQIKLRSIDQDYCVTTILLNYEITFFFINFKGYRYIAGLYSVRSVHSQCIYKFLQNNFNIK